MTDEASMIHDAWRAALQAVLLYVPVRQRQEAADTAMAIAMGIIHGCCGPNGDFTSEWHQGRAESR